MDSNYRSHTTAVLDQGNLAFADYTPMIALSMKVAGEVKLQLVNDVHGNKGDATDAHWNKTEHPTWILGWMGQFGGIYPMVDIGSYDNNKSRYFDVGVKTAMAGLNATLDFHSDSEVFKGADAKGKAKGFTETKTGLALNVAYEMKGSMTPWFHYSSFDAKQPTDKDAGLEDAKTNSYVAASGSTPGHYTWDDNGSVIGVGADFAFMGKGWTPYVAIVTQSGKFDKNLGKGAKVEEESKSEMNLKLGVLGEI